MKSLLFESGFSTPPSSVTIDMKESIVSLLLEYQCIIKCKAMMDQFIQGLQNLEVFTMVRDNPEAMNKFFVSEESKLWVGKNIYILNFLNFMTNYFIDSVLSLFQKTFGE